MHAQMPDPHRMELSFITLDVFTTTPCRGNPLAIVKVPSALSPHLSQAQKQQIAREFNLSETIFLHDRTAGKNEYVVDIFTDTTELPFAGHPTIGAATYVLHLAPHTTTSESINTTHERERERSVLVTKAGAFPISRTSETAVSAQIPHNVHIHARTISSAPTSPSPSYFLPSPLSVHPIISEAERAAPIVSIVKGMTFLLVRLPTTEVLGRVEGRAQVIDFKGVLDKEWRETFVATYYYVLLPERMGDRTVHVRTRMVEATMEDPATGSAACALSSFLALTGVGVEHGGRVGKYQVVQGVEMGRESVIGVEVELEEKDRSKIETISLSGSAVKVMEGKLWI